MVTLNAGERSVLAAFPNSTQAKAAKKELEAKGVSTVQLDTVRRFPAEPDSDYNNPLNRATSLSSLTLYSDGGSGGDAGPLLAADPSASGLAGDNPLAAFKPYLITAVVPEERVQEVVALLKQHGGEV